MSVTREDVSAQIQYALETIRAEILRVRNSAVDDAKASDNALEAKLIQLQYAISALTERLDTLDTRIQQYRDDKFTATRRMIVEILKERDRA